MSCLFELNESGLQHTFLELLSNEIQTSFKFKDNNKFDIDFTISINYENNTLLLTIGKEKFFLININVKEIISQER